MWAWFADRRAHLDVLFWVAVVATCLRQAGCIIRTHCFHTETRNKGGTTSVVKNTVAEVGALVAGAAVVATACGLCSPGGRMEDKSAATAAGQGPTYPSERNPKKRIHSSMVFRGPETNFAPRTGNSVELSQTAAPGLADSALRKAMNAVSEETPLAAGIKGSLVPSNMRVPLDIAARCDSHGYDLQTRRTVGNFFPNQVVDSMGTSRPKRMLSMTVVVDSSGCTVVQAVSRSEHILFTFLVLALEGGAAATWRHTDDALGLNYDASFGADLSEGVPRFSEAAFLYLFGYTAANLQAKVTGALKSALDGEVARGDIDEAKAAGLRETTAQILAAMEKLEAALAEAAAAGADGAPADGAPATWRALTTSQMQQYLRSGGLGLGEASSSAAHYSCSQWLSGHLLKTFRFSEAWGMPPQLEHFTAITFPTGGLCGASLLKGQVYYENALHHARCQYRSVTPLTAYGMTKLPEPALAVLQHMATAVYSSLYPAAAKESAALGSMALPDFRQLWLSNVDAKSRFVGGVDKKGSFGADVLANFHLGLASLSAEPRKAQPACSCIVFSDHYDERKGEFYGDERLELAEEARLRCRSSRGNAMLPVVQLISPAYKAELRAAAAAAATPGPEPEPEPEGMQCAALLVRRSTAGSVHYVEAEVPTSMDHDDAAALLCELVSAIAADGARAQNTVLLVVPSGGGSDGGEIAAMLPDYSEQTRDAATYSFELAMYALWAAQCGGRGCAKIAAHDASDNDFDDVGAQESDVHALAATLSGTSTPPPTLAIGVPAPPMEAPCRVRQMVGWERFADREIPGATIERAVTVYYPCHDARHAEDHAEDEGHGMPADGARKCTIVSNHASGGDGGGCSLTQFAAEYYGQLISDAAVLSSRVEEGEEGGGGWVLTQSSQEWREVIDDKLRRLSGPSSGADGSSDEHQKDEACTTDLTASVEPSSECSLLDSAGV
eukprot:SAG11_NODE_154_length_14340_cov_19.803946_6_plen_955_part_00